MIKVLMRSATIVVTKPPWHDACLSRSCCYFVYIYICIYIYLCVCVCVCECMCIHTHTKTHTQQSFVINDCGLFEDKSRFFESQKVDKICNNIQAFWFLFQWSQVMEFNHAVVTFCCFISTSLLFQETCLPRRSLCSPRANYSNILSTGIFCTIIVTAIAVDSTKTFSRKTIF